MTNDPHTYTYTHTHTPTLSVEHDANNGLRNLDSVVDDLARLVETNFCRAVTEQWAFAVSQSKTLQRYVQFRVVSYASVKYTRR